MKPSTIPPVVLATALFVLAGCESRSISNSGFDHRYNYAGRGGQADGYAGELSELDVLGVTPDSAITEADIRTALQGATGVRLEPASKVLLIQSGAEFPDAPMLEALSRQFSVAPFSGKPRGRADGAPSYSKSLRLAAARGGYDKIVCYWGVLESERKNKITAAVSWVPVIGSVIPDERENMRIQLKAAIVDVASGRWSIVTPAPRTSTSLSSIVGRRTTDQDLVTALKTKGYRDLAEALARQPAGEVSPPVAVASAPHSLR